jgi:hypothetical protein
MSVTDPVSRAEAAIPGLAETRAALAAARKARGQAIGKGDALRNQNMRSLLVGQVIDELVTGGEVLSDLGERAWRARHAFEHVEHELDVLRSVESMLAERERSVLREHADDGLQVLGEQLAELLQEARELAAELGAVRTAAQAVTGSPREADAYRRMTELASTYQSMRSAQFSLTKAGWPGTGDFVGDVQLFAVLANVDGVWPGRKPAHGKAFTDPPWPTQGGSSTLPAHDLAFLWWAMDTPAARVWLPTSAELQDAFTAAHKAIEERNCEEAQARGLVPIRDQYKTRRVLFDR